MNEPPTECTRCGAPCKVNPDRSPDARLLRRSRSTGVCANCAVTAFLKYMEPFATVFREVGPSALGMPAFQAQFATVLTAGNADAKPEELDWPTIIDQWELPL